MLHQFAQKFSLLIGTPSLRQLGQRVHHGTRFFHTSKLLLFLCITSFYTFFEQKKPCFRNRSTILTAVFPFVSSIFVCLRLSFLLRYFVFLACLFLRRDIRRLVVTLPHADDRTVDGPSYYHHYKATTYHYGLYRLSIHCQNSLMSILFSLSLLFLFCTCVQCVSYNE